MDNPGEGESVPGPQHFLDDSPVENPDEIVYDTLELHGRPYAVRTPGYSYMWPIDEEAFDAADLWHEFFCQLRNDRPWTVPVPMDREGLKIVDVGAGPGTWSFDLAYLDCPNAHVVALDIVMQGPLEIPDNLQFEEFDVNEAWPVAQNPTEEGADLIYIRMMAGCVRDWAHVHAGVFGALKPEQGWMEHLEVEFVPRCDSGPVGERVRAQFDELLSAMEEYGLSMRINSPAVMQGLRNAGFVDIKEEVFDMPLSEWTDDVWRNEVGRYFNLALTQMMEEFLLCPLYRIKRRTLAEVRHTAREAKRDIFNKACRLYMKVYVWSARRPPLPPV